METVVRFSVFLDIYFGILLVMATLNMFPFKRVEL
jgi:hypothetical protein